MLVFIDESGDPGLDTKRGASKFFTVALVVFEENEEALACDQRIQLLKKELRWEEGDEFHFKRNSDKTRKAFLEAVAPYNFFYYGIVFDKDPKKLSSDIFKNKRSFYSYACGLLFESAKNRLLNTSVIVDRSGGTEFRSELTRYLRKKMNEDGKTPIIKNVKMQSSQSNNLLQLADYIAGVIGREAKDEKKFAQEYKKLVSHREMEVQRFPK